MTNPDCPLPTTMAQQPPWGGPPGGGMPPGGSPPGGFGPPPGGYGGPPPGGFGGPPPGGFGPPPGAYAPPPAAYAPQAPFGGGPMVASGGGGGPPTGLMIGSLVTMILGCIGFVLGLIPCLGWVNWLSAPFNLIPVIIGIVGLVGGPTLPDGSRAHLGIHVAAIILGVIGMVGGSLRCLLGGGLF